MKRGIRQRFFNNKLTKIDLESVEVVKNKHIKFNPFIRESGGYHYIVEGYGTIYHSGMAQGSLCNKSKSFMNKKKPETWVSDLQVDLLVIKTDSELYSKRFTGGYYYFNSWRSRPDSVLAFKPSNEKNE